MLFVLCCFFFETELSTGSLMLKAWEKPRTLYSRSSILLNNDRF